VLQVLDEIEKLKLTLEESQEQRRRKIAYDEIADKINELSSRSEQEK
jgi:THO complex subunit 7